ncbi:MAG: hypothetical protein QOG03_910 [Actinomycetota bacterium]|nr:hypothetical protein [Actinomycetota bacterium]
MTRLRRRAPTEERGFTIVEIVVAMTVMAVGVFGTMNVFLSTLRTTSMGEARTRASALASQEVEAMRSAPYAQVGFATSQTGYRATFESKSTVVVSNPVFAPTTTPYTFDGQVFTITRDIVWAPFGTVTQAYKRVTAQIVWVDKIGTHSVRQDGGVYPGGLGPAGTTTTTVATTTTTAPVTPGTAGTVTAVKNPTNPTHQIDVSWTGGSPTPTYWEVQYSSNSGTTWVQATANQPGASFSYALSGLSSGTTYTVRVRGLLGRATSNWIQASAATDAPPPTCAVTSGSVSPSTVQKKSNGQLNTNLVVTVNTTGPCTGLKVRYPTDASPPTYTLAQSGATFTDTFDKNDTKTWSTGAKIIQILLSTGTQIGSISLTVTN